LLSARDGTLVGRLPRSMIKTALSSTATAMPQS